MRKENKKTNARLQLFYAWPPVLEGKKPRLGRNLRLDGFSFALPQVYMNTLYVHLAVTEFVFDIELNVRKIGKLS